VKSGRSCWMTSYPDELPETRLLLPGMLTDPKKQFTGNFNPIFPTSRPDE
jgi:hypothetical protein